MRFVLTMLTSLALFAGCKNTKVLLPNVSGKAGEVIVVMDKDNWEGDLGEQTRELLAAQVPYLAQSEPLFSLTNVAPTGFNKLFRVHRNVVIFQIDPQLDTTGVFYRRDLWSAPQCVVQLSAYDAEGAQALLKKSGWAVARYIEQCERDRIIENAYRYEQHSLAQKVSEVFGGCMHFPNGYKLRKATEDFIWIADDKQYVYQDVLIYKYPAEESHPFTADNIISHRDEILRANVPGMFEGTYMTTSAYFTPMVEYLKYRGRDLVQTRGMWEVENDYMGGPFVSHSFYSRDGSEIIVLEAFVYAPRFDKRHYLRQVESLLYSWEWDK